MPYIPPHKRNATQQQSVVTANQFNVLSDDPVTVKKALEPKRPTTYVPPSQRKVDPLAPENFPALGTVAVAQQKQPALNFLKQVQYGEEQRDKLLEESLNYDPAKLEALTERQLEKEGWAVLRPHAITAERFNQRCADKEDSDLDWLDMVVSLPIATKRIPGRILAADELDVVSEVDSVEEEDRHLDFEQEQY